MKKFRKFAIIAVLLAALVFGEYRLIMHSIKPRVINEHCVQIEFLGFVDEYYCDNLVPIAEANA